jgi:hypothetical protein
MERKNCPSFDIGQNGNKKSGKNEELIARKSEKSNHRFAQSQFNLSFIRNLYSNI